MLLIEIYYICVLFKVDCGLFVVEVTRCEANFFKAAVLSKLRS